MTVFAGLSYLSLLLIAIWVFLISLAFTGNEWVNVQSTINLKALSSQIEQAKLSAAKSYNKHGYGSFDIPKIYTTPKSYNPTGPWKSYDYRTEKQLPTSWTAYRPTTRSYGTPKSWNTYRETTRSYGTPESWKSYDSSYKTMSPHKESTEDIMESMAQYLPPSMKNTMSTLSSSVEKVVKFLTIGIQNYCLRIELEGSLKIFDAVEMSTCVDMDLYNHPTKYGLPKEFTAYSKKQTKDIRKTKTCLQITMFFTAVVVLLMLLKPVFLGSKFQVHYYGILVGLAIIAMIIGAVSIAFARKESNLLTDLVNDSMKMSGITGNNFVTLKTNVGTSIIYMSFAVLSIFVGALTNLAEAFYTKKVGGSGVDYNAFGLKPQNA